jgi:hypothetical protein
VGCYGVGGPGPAEPTVIDVARCVEVPVDVQADIENAITVGKTTDVSDAWQVRLDRADTGPWAAVQISDGYGPPGYWIATWIDLAHSWAPPRPANEWSPLNEVSVLALYFVEGDLAAPGPLYKEGDLSNGYKVQVADLPSVTPVIGDYQSDGDAIATLAECLGYDHVANDDPSGQHEPWMWDVSWWQISEQPTNSRLGE